MKCVAVLGLLSFAEGALYVGRASKSISCQRILYGFRFLLFFGYFPFLVGCPPWFSFFSIFGGFFLTFLVFIFYRVLGIRSVFAIFSVHFPDFFSNFQVRLA